MARHTFWFTSAHCKHCYLSIYVDWPKCADRQTRRKEFIKNGGRNGQEAKQNDIVEISIANVTQEIFLWKTHISMLIRIFYSVRKSQSGYSFSFASCFYTHYYHNHYYSYYIIILLIWECFTPGLAHGCSQDSERHKVPSSLQDSS